MSHGDMIHLLGGRFGTRADLHSSEEKILVNYRGSWDNELREKYESQLSACFDADFLLDLFFGLEGGGGMFLRNIGWLSADYKALYLH
jgi:hypothetical protein